MRKPGKKFKVHEFAVEGMSIPVEIRITDDNKFYAEVDNDKFEEPTFAELKDLIQPRLEQLHKLVYDPVIDVTYSDPGDDNDGSYYGGNSRRESFQRQELKLEISAGYVSRSPVSTAEDRAVYHRWIAAGVDEATAELGPLNIQRQGYAERMYHRDVEKLIPFTPERWRRLTAILTALTDARAKLAYVLADTTANLLDALPATPSNLLEAMPPPPADRKRKRR